MSQVRLYIQGKSVEIDKQIYFSTLQGMSKNIPWLAHQACEDHRLGNINAHGSQQVKFLKEKDETYQALLDAIEDRQLKKFFDQLEVLEQKILEHDAKMLKWLALYYQIPSLDNAEQCKRFN